MTLDHLPKVELHCHLDGIVDPDLLRDIVREQPDFPLKPETLAARYPVNDYDSFWNWWPPVNSLKTDLLNFAPILVRHIARLKAQRVRYFEVMIPSGSLPTDSGAAVDKVAALREHAAAAAGADGEPIQVEFLVIFGRSRPPDYAERLADTIIALHRAGLVVGAGLAGPENGFPVEPFARSFERLRAAGLGIEIHAGEWCGPESVWDALAHGCPHRIGHGVSAFEDERLLDRLQEQGIHLEFSPTSNLLTGSVDAIAQHPIRQALARGMSFSVNTDDPGALLCSINSEYALLADTFGFTAADFRRIAAQSLAARFQPVLHVDLGD